MIFGEAKKFEGKSDFYISIRIIEKSSVDTTQIIADLRKYFEDRREKEKHQVRIILNQGLQNLLIAFTFLIIIYLLTNLMMRLLTESALMITLRELFIILAWVALWRPAELLLYEWRPHKRNAKLFDTIAKCEIGVNQSPSDNSSIII